MRGNPLNRAGAHAAFDALLDLIENAQETGDEKAVATTAKEAISFLINIAGPEVMGWLDNECRSSMLPLKANPTKIEFDEWRHRRTRHALAMFLNEFAPQFDFSEFGGTAVLHELWNMNHNGPAPRILAKASRGRGEKGDPRLKDAARVRVVQIVYFEVGRTGQTVIAVLDQLHPLSNDEDDKKHTARQKAWDGMTKSVGKDVREAAKALGKDAVAPHSDCSNFLAVWREATTKAANTPK